MESIDRLRDWLKGRLLMGNGWNELNEIADAIEREVKANRVDAYTKGYDEGFASADDLAAQHEDAMAGHGWVRLPVDAEGVPIRLGDVMEGVDKYDVLREVKGKVITVSFESDGAADVAIQAWSSDGKSWHRAYLDPYASVYRHYHAPTVEDVLREFALACEDAGNAGPEVERIAAEYAARLRMAGEDA